MNKPNRGLGRGLSALFSDTEEAYENAAKSYPAEEAMPLPEDIKGHTRAGAADWRRELSGLVGMADVKKQVRKLENRVKVHGGSGAAVIGGNNMVLMGPAGTKAVGR